MRHNSCMFSGSIIARNRLSVVFGAGVLLFLMTFSSLTFVAQPAEARVSCGDRARGDADASSSGRAPLDTSFDYNCPEDTQADASDLSRNPIFVLLLYGVNFLAAGVGIAAVGFIVWGSILYAGSDGTAETAKRGISYITNAVIGLVLFLAMYAIINFLVPGGLLN